MENISTEELQRLRKIEEKTKKRIKDQNERNKKNYDRISFVIKSGLKKHLEELAQANGKTVNGYLKELVEGEIERFRAGNAENAVDELPEFMRDY
jgi:predicted DNA-binding protein